ncbi:hypothetical protein BDF21DRAFT_140575 [Thamnidium elegans]|uniref:Uncharacterized protein n=1 Tax=Thamnidium elegans TaxID=101142 RepID=A0A8H7SSU5_9FUNG|nr:hypothetical protein INT48_003440 [Thamnidium elegans]KAI8059737.1 hypothetical protein BDF21DRAFT_140575 [Thamnidium elegans]
MTSISENDGNNASWLKQRTTIFNSATSNKPAPKVVDKELARLKNIGAVSSVWSNKFVQEDNSGGTNEYKNKRNTPPPEPPLSPRQRFLLMNKIDISPRPNADYIPGIRQSLSSPPPPTSPKSPAFNSRARTLSGNNKKMADDISAALENQQVESTKQTNSFGYFSKNSMSSLDLNDVKTSASIRSSVTSSTTSSVPPSPINRTSTEYMSTSPVSSAIRTPSIDEAASLWFQCETLKTQFAQSNSKLNKANEDIEFYKRQLEKNAQVARDEGTAASLWFETEALKTQFAQTNAKLNKANEDIEFYKRQLEKNAQVARDEGTAASLWFETETLKTQFAQTNAKLNKANEDIEFYKRQQENSTQIARDEGTAASLWFETETLKTQFAQTNAKLNKANEDVEFYKRQMEKSAEIARDEGAAASLWFQCETLKTQFAQNNAKLNKANEDIEFYKRQMEKTAEIEREEGAAASLWFQCETLKTQFAQSNARLNRANEDIEFYKRQLEQNGEVAREGMATVVEEKELETKRVRELAELIVKQDKLLGEYEINLECLTRLTDEAGYLEATEGEMKALRQELVALNTQKELMESTIVSLRAELEMCNSQMRLMMVVSTEIQNEFDSFKAKIDSDIKDMLNKKQIEHEAELKHLQQAHATSTDSVLGERSMASTEEEKNDAASVAAAVAAATAAATATAAIAASEREKAFGALRDQISTLTAAVQEKDQAIAEAMQAKDKAIAEMENRLKAQKMATDAQMMELNQTILEKDTLLMEFMSSRNNSREVISAAASMSPTTVVPAAAVTNTYFHPHENESRLHINEIREYMFSSSEDEDEAEVLMMSYSTDEEDEHTQHQYHGHYRNVINTDTHASTPQSPADTISSSISFDSDEEEEEKVAEIKHFSYSSVQSQPTRPVSLISTTESLSGDMDKETNQRSSLRNSSTVYNAAKETKTASWPMPPPTPPPSEPLPPVPVLQIGEEKDVINLVPEASATSPIAKVSSVPPPRRARSKTMARDDVPDMSAYTTSVHQSNDLPRIIPLQKPVSEPPVPAPRKDLPILNTETNNFGKEQHTKWMDDPESEEDELWCEANATPKQPTPEWNIL